MVDPEGKAYEISVADNIGNDDFIDAAIAHLGETVFQPARIGEEVVHGSSRLFYRFILENAPAGARHTFVNRYKNFNTRLRKDSQEEAERGLAELEAADVQNVYEYSYLSLARYFYADRYGTSLAQMEHLGQALKAIDDQDEKESFLGKEPLAVRRVLFQLQVRNGYYAEAFDTLRVMERKGDDEGISLFRDAVGRLEALRANDRAYGIPGRIAANGYWDIKLFKNKFRLDDVTGTIDELKLRCQRSFVFFDFDPEIEYSVSNVVGNCELQIVGDADSTFTLVQM